ncbi:MAG: hypothetical protein EAZ13_03020 [Sphingobacteriia bacterium]|nr:MAG: hypothetical protein EAZ13_03020 [Sphingobacteriia bacterium]
MRILFIAALLALLPALKAQKNHFVDSLQALLKKSTIDSNKVKYQIALGEYYLFTDPKESEKWFLKSNQTTITPKLKDLANKAYAANSMVQVCFVLGRAQEAEQWMTKSIELSEGSKDVYTMANAYLNAANVYSQTQRFNKAIPFAQKSIAIYDSLGENEKSIKALIALGNIFVQLPKFDKALEYYKKAELLNVKAKKNKNFCFLVTYDAIAYVYQQKKKYDSVIYYCNLAEPFTKSNLNPDLSSNLLLLKASALEQVGTNTELIAAARAGKQICEANNVNHYRVMFYAQMARAFAKNKLGDSAFYYAKLTEKWADSSNMTNKQVEVFNTWASVYAYFGNYDQAYLFKQKAYDANEALKEAEVAAQTTTANIMFETEKKEKQIEYLAAINKQQRITEWVIGIALFLAIVAAGFAFASYKNKNKLSKALQQSNQEKDVFLKEIHHRVKNNLQIISSLLYMQFKDSNNPVMMAQLKQAQERIKSMALVHNKLYESNDVVHIYLKEYIADLAVGILAANTPNGKNIGLEIMATESIQLSLDTSISVGLILNELITNSCKYAFQSQNDGNIAVHIQPKEKGFLLTVRDNGCGLPLEFDQKNSLGVRLVKNMARQLNGQVQFTNEDGTVVTIFFNDSIAA